MKLLMIDTSGIVASAAILEEERLIGEFVINYKKKHSESLLPAIDHLFQDTCQRIEEMDAFGVVKGPGSFTGLRIGLATVKGFAQAMNKPVVGVSTLEALAANLLFAEGIVCPMLDARRNQVFTGIYRTTSGAVESVLSDTIMTIDALTEKLEELQDDKPVFLLGDAARLYDEKIREKVSNAVKVPPVLLMNRAASAAHIGLQKLLAGESEDYKSLAPSYLRPSYAEEQ